MGNRSAPLSSCGTGHSTNCCVTSSRRRARRTPGSSGSRRTSTGATTGLDRLYQAVEEGALSIDETLRTQTLKARRSEVLTETAKLKDRQALAVRRVNADTVQGLCAALKERFADPASGLGKAYLRLLVDEIRLDGNELVITGSHRRLADAIGFMQKR